MILFEPVPANDDVGPLTPVASTPEELVASWSLQKKDQDKSTFDLDYNNNCFHFRLNWLTNLGSEQEKLSKHWNWILQTTNYYNVISFTFHNTSWAINYLIHMWLFLSDYIFIGNYNLKKERLTIPVLIWGTIQYSYDKLNI